MHTWGGVEAHQREVGGSERLVEIVEAVFEDELPPLHGGEEEDERTAERHRGQQHGGEARHLAALQIAHGHGRWCRCSRAGRSSRGSEAPARLRAGGREALANVKEIGDQEDREERGLGEDQEQRPHLPSRPFARLGRRGAHSYFQSGSSGMLEVP